MFVLLASQFIHDRPIIFFKKRKTNKALVLGDEMTVCFITRYISLAGPAFCCTLASYVVTPARDKRLSNGSPSPYIHSGGTNSHSVQVYEIIYYTNLDCIPAWRTPCVCVWLLLLCILTIRCVLTCSTQQCANADFNSLSLVHLMFTRCVITGVYTVVYTFYTSANNIILIFFSFSF